MQTVMEDREKRSFLNHAAGSVIPAEAGIHCLYEYSDEGDQPSWYVGCLSINGAACKEVLLSLGAEKYHGACIDCSANSMSPAVVDSRLRGNDEAGVPPIETKEKAGQHNSAKYQQSYGHKPW
jgi:hypothetical protein